MRGKNANTGPYTYKTNTQNNPTDNNQPTHPTSKHLINTTQMQTHSGTRPDSGPQQPAREAQRHVPQFNNSTTQYIKTNLSGEAGTTKASQPKKRKTTQMQIQIFSIYDSKAEAYLPPFYSQNPRTALRQMVAAVTDASHQFCKYPEDYTLFHIGSFDDELGLVQSLGANVSLGTALQIRQTELRQVIGNGSDQTSTQETPNV